MRELYERILLVVLAVLGYLLLPLYILPRELPLLRIHLKEDALFSECDRVEESDLDA